MSSRGKQAPNDVDTIVEAWGRVRPDLDVSALKVFGRLHRGFLLYRSAIGVGFAEVGTNESGFDVLAALRRAEPQRVNAGALARQTLVTTGGVSLRLRRLERAGLVRRERDPDDNRIVYVSLTDAGRELVDRAADAHFANLLRMLDGLTAKERKDLARLLGRLYEALADRFDGVELDDVDRD